MTTFKGKPVGSETTNETCGSINSSEDYQIEGKADIEGTRENSRAREKSENTIDNEDEAGKERARKILEELKELETIRRNELINLYGQAQKKLDTVFNKRSVSKDGVEIVNDIIRKLYYGSFENGDTDGAGQKNEHKKKKSGYRKRNETKYERIEMQISSCINSEVYEYMKKEKKVYLTLQFDNEDNAVEISRLLMKEEEVIEKEKDRQSKMQADIDRYKEFLKKKGKEHDLQIFELKISGKKNKEIAEIMGIEKRIVENRDERIRINLRKRFEEKVRK
jgi:hypothetical protein